MHPDLHWTGTILHAITFPYLKLTIMVLCTTNIYLAVDFHFALQIPGQRSRIDLKFVFKNAQTPRSVFEKRGCPPTTSGKIKQTVRLYCAVEKFLFFWGFFVIQFQIIKINVTSEHELKSLVLNLLTHALCLWVI